jgi:protein-S-isoprenylcysteine O-methyltransferase Ste14
MYLDLLLFLFGESWFVGSWRFFFHAIAWLIFVHLIVLLYEEPNLRRRFGPACERYAATVHRWLPERKHGGSE